MLNQRLQQKLLQKLSPQQIQLIKLLEVPTLQLEQRIKKEIEENPALEEGSEDVLENNEDEISEEENIIDEQNEFSLEDYINEEDTPAYKLSSKNYSPDDEKKEIPFSIGSTFHEHLKSQLGLRILSEKQIVLADYIIGNIDEAGYLRRKPNEIVDDIVFAQGITTKEEEIDEILMIIQDFDPPGIGALDLQECLIIQIERKDITIYEINLARKILKHHFTEFTKKHYDKILLKLDITEEDLKIAIDEILKLNPKPGSSFSDAQNKFSPTIIPDFSIDFINGELQLTLNSRNVPELKVNRTYADMLETYSLNQKKKTKNERETISFVKQKLDSARWFIDAIKQRQNTLILTMNAILKYQEEYFIDGDEKRIKPMILKDIAERTGLDISTISRVANSKYIQTHFGIFSLKSFFSESMQTISGEEVSTKEIKNILKECVDNEGKRKPLTDEKLTSILREKGYKIARRTVAKYREQLNIPVARLRKEL
ncbi:MAG: RNA polymerase factor sigma-54 [Bacteroidales bacterium]|nr:RNA polymerase factor sigma-54 [Bacteroidales bacterium]